VAAWRALQTTRGQRRAVVGSCPCCAQPLVTDAPGEGIEIVHDWTLTTPEGTVQVGTQVEGPDGVLEDDEVEEWLLAATRVPIEVKPGLALFQGALLTMTFIPFMLWGICAFIVLLFLTNVYK
jgi:hypothetical protein